MSDIKVSTDHVNPNMRYLRYEMPGDGVGVMDFGDGDTTPVFPPRGQVTHTYADGTYTATVKRGDTDYGSAYVSVGDQPDRPAEPEAQPEAE